MSVVATDSFFVVCVCVCVLGFFVIVRSHLFLFRYTGNAVHRVLWIYLNKFIGVWVFFYHRYFFFEYISIMFDKIL